MNCMQKMSGINTGLWLAGFTQMNRKYMQILVGILEEDWACSCNSEEAQPSLSMIAIQARDRFNR